MSILPRPLNQALTTTMSRWFAKRAPKSDSATLNLRNVYIFFSREGLLFAVLLAITFIAGINYGNNLVLGLCFYLISVWLISFHVTFAHISGLKVQLVDVTMAEVGRPVWVTLKVHNTSRQPRRQLMFRFDQDGELGTGLDTPEPKSGTKQKYRKSITSDKSEYANAVKNQQRSVLLSCLQDEQIIRLPIKTRVRGQLELPRLQVKTVYPLGIMRAWSYVYFARIAWVYPKPLTFDWQTQYSQANSEDLPLGGQYTQGQDDFDRLDSYIEGESLARVSWAHVAREQGMLTKHFGDPIGHEQLLDYKDMPAANHEQKLAQLAYGALALGQLNVPFKMQLSHDSASKAATLGQGEIFAQACLLRLAKTP